ncbi:MFS transporter [Mucilaginibacter celer]|uniref:MFS transporter n=1 Tax=Mucilaginibacter celer TaxID=2305508 RepID=A0A494VHR4_9SPHI|nr:MFS transporter [Mucilaginibacter celer]AYL94307.1 MFS transporter [Mucilaginibacter celer]
MPESKSRWIALLIVLFAPLLSVIDVFIINIAIPAIRKGVHATEAEVQLVIASYLLGYAAFLITGGRLGDHFGRKRIFLTGMLLFTATSCWCGLSGSALELNIARFFQGVSAALMVPQTLSYIQLLFQNPEDRAKAVGWFGFTLGVASIAGQFLGGFLTWFHFFIPGWRLIFFINLPLGIISLAGAFRYLKETGVNASSKFDIPGVVLLTVSLFCLIIPLILGREYGWPWWSWAILLSSALLFFLFFKNQDRKRLRGGAPLINTDLLKFRDFNIGLLCVFCLFVFHNTYLLISTLLFQNGFQYNPFIAGKLFVIFGIGSTISSLYSGKLIGRYGKKVVLAGVFFLFVSIGAQLFFFSSDHYSQPFIALMLFIHGAGMGVAIPSTLNVTLKSVPAEFAGAASGLYSTFQQTSSALGVSVIGGVFFSVLGKYADRLHYEQAFKAAGLCELLTLLILSVLLLIMPDSPGAAVHIGE